LESDSNPIEHTDKGVVLLPVRAPKLPIENSTAVATI